MKPRKGGLLLTPYWISLVLAVGFTLAAQKTAQPSNGKLALKTWGGRDGRTYSRWGVVASAAVFILLTGFRYGIGQDYFYTYVPYFEQVRMGIAPPDIEVGYYLLNWAVSRFTDDPTPVFLFCSIAFIGLTYAAIMRESSHPVLSVFLLFGMSFLFIFMNAMRQMTAVALLLFSIRYIDERRLAPFIACVALSSTFHGSSVLFLVAYLLPKLTINIPVCVVLTMAFLAFKSQIASIVNLIIEQTQYSGYIGSIFDTGETGSVIIAMNAVVLLFAAVAPRLFGEEYSERYKLLLWCQLIATLIAILSGAIPLSQRIRWIFALPAIILLPLAIDAIGDKRARFLVQITVVVLYVTYIAITIGLWNGNNVVPYQSVFFRNVV